MKPIILFGRSGTRVIRTAHPRRARCAIAGAIAALIALYAFVAWLDLEPSLPVAGEAALQRAYEEGRAQGHAEMIASVEAAWQAADTEANFCRARYAAARGGRP